LSPALGPLRSAPAIRQRKRPTLRDVPVVVGQALLRHRRLAAAGCAALAVAIALGSLAPPRPPTVQVVATTHDVATGTVLKPDDVRGATLPASVQVWTIEGAAEIAAVAIRNFQELDIVGVELVVGNFDEKLNEVLDCARTVDLVFIDGNHRLEPTLRYFRQIMERCAPGAILIFDDVHWSEEMEKAWEEIQRDPRVYMTIDLFFIGLVVIREEFKVKQHFTIRF